MSKLVDAWQGALAAEQQAVFGYSLLGPHLATKQQHTAARGDQSAHAALNDATASALTAAGQVPVPPHADYPALYPVASARAAVTLAIRLEHDTAAAWRFLYAAVAAANGDPPLRAAAQQALTDSAVRAARWRVVAGDATPTVAFPGI